MTARVLWASVETPAQDGQGGQRRQFHQIKALRARGWDITVMVPTAGQSDVSIRTIVPVLRPRFAVRGRVIPPLLRRTRRNVGDERWDAIVVSHHESIWMLPERPSAPVLLDVHNVMSAWHRVAGRDDEALAAASEESAAIRRSDGVMTCSETELRRLLSAHPGAADTGFAAPLGVDPDEWPEQPFTRDDPRVVLFGSWSWEPNRRGLEWFLASVWPRVTARCRGARCLVAGSGVDDDRSWPDGARFVGRVDDLAAFGAAATVVAVPVITGVGASVKFAEALATGAAVVATPDGANAVDDPPAFVSDDPADWADWIADRLERRTLEGAPHQARGFALSRLDWDAAVNPIDRWLREHVADPPARTRPVATDDPSNPES